MQTILLAWNPKKWPWGDLDNELRRLSSGTRHAARWSVHRKEIASGSRFFLIRLGDRPTGIVGRGVTSGATSVDRHWSGNGKTARYVGIRFDYLRREPIISWDELQGSPFSAFRWGIQSSGVTIPEATAIALEELFEKRATGRGSTTAEELSMAEAHIEGARTTIVVNRYERDLAAREKCLNHYGFHCSVCDSSLRDKYGDIAQALIHVHHIRPLSRIRRSYVVDPIRDLRPVCPNCHAVLHLRTPPLEISEARSLLSKGRC